MYKLKLFMVNRAEYFLNDGEGKRITMVVDYYNNRYFLKTRGRKLEPFLINKAREIAFDLLGKKHRINFSYKYDQTKP